MSQYVFKRAGLKRQKYTPHACFECHRRKVKCSGGEVCSGCSARGVDCTYEENNQRGRKPLNRSQGRQNKSTSSPGRNSVGNEDTQGVVLLLDQIVQLQKKVEAIHELQHSLGGDFNERRPSTSSQPLGDDPINSDFLHTASQSAISGSVSDVINPHLNTTSFDPQRCRSALFQTTDTFVPRARNATIISDSSKIEALQRLYANKAPSAALLTPSTKAGSRLAVQLPKPSILWSRVNIFFREFPCYFPFIRENQAIKQVSAMLETVGFSEDHCKVLVPVEHCKTMAILLNTLAYGEAVMAAPPKAGNNTLSEFESLPGSESYCIGLGLLESFACLYDHDIETVTYHALSASFFFAIENLQMALSSASTSFHIARSINLNDESRWPPDLENEFVCRQSLWWTLYFLDKRISQKIGITYNVREDECSVREFPEEKIDPQGHHELLQTMITFSHLWAKIWDCFFAPASQAANRWEELEVLDTRILVASRRLPSSLRWNTDELSLYSLEESERQVRRRLLVYLRFCFLRLSIRHNGLPSANSERQRRLSCVQICKQMIDAIQAYINTFGRTRPSGYMLTSALVESVYWVESERQQSNPVTSDAVLVNLTIRAVNVLQDMAMDIGAAARAYESLNKILPSCFPTATGSSALSYAPVTPKQFLGTQHQMQTYECPEAGLLEPIEPAESYNTGSFLLNPAWGEECLSLDWGKLEEYLGNPSSGMDWTTSVNDLSSAEYNGILFGTDA